ncbi:MAG: HAMP domain-containing histidine kinase [Bacteroides sp.]|nr:HAMP domain-containing histidine kinase [Bacteroides sp.]
MKKTFLILICISFYGLILQGQTNPTSDLNPTGLNELQREFQELFKQKDVLKAIEKGTQVSEILLDGKRYKEAASLYYQMDQLIYEDEKKTGKTNFRGRFQVANERLRMYTQEGKAESSKTQLNVMHYCMNYLKDDNLTDKMLLTEAEYYHTFGMANKSLESYKKLLQRCLSSKNEDSREDCYKDMLSYAERKKITPLTETVQKLYVVWQDSVNMVKAARELESLQQEHTVLQQDLQSKEKTIRNQKAIIVGLWIFIVILIAALVVLFFLLLKNMFQAKKLKHNLKMINESNAQKSHFISNINTQITPALEIIENLPANSFYEKNVRENIDILKKRVADMQTYIYLEESREEPYPVQSIDIKQLCDGIMLSSRSNFKPGIESVVSVPRVSIKTNADALERILSYLLNRSALHTNSGKISLEFKKRNARTGQFIITDTGTPPDPEKQENLFKPFGEQDLTIDDDGWGLPICQLIAYKLNGTIKVDTDYKKGTRFILDLCS